MSNKKSGISREQRRMRTQQVIFSVLSIIVILAWIIGLIAK